MKIVTGKRIPKSGYRTLSQRLQELLSVQCRSIPEDIQYKLDAACWGWEGKPERQVPASLKHKE
jgi:hypothetical protein